MGSKRRRWKQAEKRDRQHSFVPQVRRSHTLYTTICFYHLKRHLHTYVITQASIFPSIPFLFIKSYIFYLNYLLDFWYCVLMITWVIWQWTDYSSLIIKSSFYLFIFFYVGVQVQVSAHVLYWSSFVCVTIWQTVSSWRF